MSKMSESSPDSARGEVVKMAICDHQFHGGDESDWILSTSVNCWDGNTTAGRILQELFKKNCRTMTNKTRSKRLKTVDVAPEKNSIEKRTPIMKNDFPSPRENENLLVKKITGFCNSENFDETQHLNGCPIKWLYNKKMLERNKIYKVERLCNVRNRKEEEERREICKNIRDKTPVEVKIHKINLVEKYTSNLDEINPPYITLSSEKSERDLKALENHRKKLAAKLNWKLHDESQNDFNFESSSEISCRHNYLPPRPLLGLKPLLSLLLSPHQGAQCCSLVPVQGDLLKKKKEEASLSIQSLDLPLSPEKSKPRPKTTNNLRWGSKSAVLSKKLQIPPQITINLNQQEKKSPRNPDKIPPVKKSNEKNKQTKTLSSLYYELKDKTNSRNQNEEEFFEEMIRDLTMEESRFKIRRFFNMVSGNSDLFDGFKMNPEKRKKLTEASSGDDSELSLVCAKVRFFEKKSFRGKQEGRVMSSH